MSLTRVPLSFAVFVAACGGIEDDPSTLLAGNTESIHVRDDVRAENGMNLIATLPLDNGNALEFYEPSPGAVLISEVGMASNPPVSMTHDLQSMSLVEIYETFAPGHAVPAALTAAQHRLDAPVALDNVTVAETDVEFFANHDDVAMNDDANQADGTTDDDAIGNPKGVTICTRKFFFNRTCKKNAFLDKKCKYDVARTEGLTRRNVRYAHGAVCAVKGRVDWEFFRIDGSIYRPQIFYVPEGHYREAFWRKQTGLPERFNVFSQVYRLPNDGSIFHMFLGVR